MSFNVFLYDPHYVGLVLLAVSILMLVVRPGLSSVFVCAYLSLWGLKDWFLRENNLYIFELQVFLGIIVDICFIIVITSKDYKTTTALPALVISLVFGAGCLVENLTGNSNLYNSYGWLMAVIAAIIVIGGFKDDPGFRNVGGHAWSWRSAARSGVIDRILHPGTEKEEH